ncbi:LETM1 domain-containing protein mdm28 [Dipodascopsis tothii]|uniref:LETM1 domain-containing protein mdm28 n=1 Tax=Dipodascopsis tothii TaxID=44089 RepID=UPI0034CFE98D
MNTLMIKQNALALSTRTLQRSAVRPTTLGRPQILLSQRAAELLRAGVAARAYSTETSSFTGGERPPPPPGLSPARTKKHLQNLTETAGRVPHYDLAEVRRAAPAETVEASVAAKKAAAENSAAAAEKDGEAKAAAKAVVAAEAKPLKKVENKYSGKAIWAKVKDELHHLKDGTLLLGAEIKISTKLVFKKLSGYELTRREHRQLTRTVQDIARLVPFSMFVIVPFAEFLLPVVLKIFPGMLPSTYVSAASREARKTLLRKTRKEVSVFLRNTVSENGLQLPANPTSSQRALFAEFFRKVRSSGESPSREELLSVCRLFKDDVVLDNLSRPQLVAMCRYMNLTRFGSDMVLRYQIRRKLRQTKLDDRAIDEEGVSSLTVTELQGACASRGFRSHGYSPARMREDLQTWLDLRLRQKVPATLLVLSSAYIYGEASAESHYDALLSVLSSIPDELFHEAELEVHNLEGAATNKQRLEVIKEQEQLIKSENQEVSRSGVAVQDDVNCDDLERRNRHSADPEPPADRKN